MARSNRNWMGALGGAALALAAMPAAAQDARIVTAGSDPAGRANPDYRWIDRAHALWDAIGDAPPDYAFAFDGGEPWAWETADGYWIVVEDRPEGMDSYFFAPGERGPFLVREIDRSFAYQGGEVAAIYESSGELVPRDEGIGYLEEGERLYARGRRLREALLDRQWQPVDTTSWVNLNLFFIGIDQRWDSGWRGHRYDSVALIERQRWEAERRRRRDQAAAFARWRAGGFQGPPPPGLGRRWDHRGHAPGWRPGRPGQPPVAGQPGRPPVAGQPGRPPVAGQPGRPPIVGQPGRPPIVGQPGRPPVAGQPGRPDRPGRPNSPGRPDRPFAPDTGPVPGPVLSAPATPPRRWPDRKPGEDPRPRAERPEREPGMGRPQPRPAAPQPPSQPQPSTPAPSPAVQPPAQPAAGAPAERPRRGGGWMSPGGTRPPRTGAPAAAPRPAAPPSAQPAARAPAPPAARAPAPPAARPAPAPRPTPAPRPVPNKREVPE